MADRHLDRCTDHRAGMCSAMMDRCVKDKWLNEADPDTWLEDQLDWLTGWKMDLLFTSVRHLKRLSINTLTDGDWAEYCIYPQIWFCTWISINGDAH